MAQFNDEKIDAFLGVVKKYMHLRGPLSQKELAELANTSDSKMSRFLNKKTNELDSQLIASITAVLDIPLHEMIDFVDESYTDQFIRLVKFMINDPSKEGKASESNFEESAVHNSNDLSDPEYSSAWETGIKFSGTKGRGFGNHSTTSANRTNPSGQVNTGVRSGSSGGRNSGDEFSRTLAGETRINEMKKRADMSVKEKLESLSPRQKNYVADFLNLDMESRDLMVDIGSSLIRYFKQKDNDL